METKQTAVEWLIERYFASNEPFDYKHLEQAKAMEKEQMKLADDNGFDRACYEIDVESKHAHQWIEIPKDFETYYNETYGK